MKSNLCVMDYSTSQVHAYHVELTENFDAESFLLEHGMQPDQCAWMMSDKMVFLTHV